ncbi:carboxylesterase family protein [Prevotella sp.]|uniref:carboxylesterase family protein n=1 Tax=Prevotella sp. TaxID=59823 RepID=UPI003AB63599
MKRLLLILCMALCSLQYASAQYDFIRPVKDSIPGGYNFWVYTPLDYYYSLESTPVIIFLHGQSLCGNNLERVRRYGPLDAIVKGRQIEALVIVPQNPGGSWNPKKINDVLEWTKKNYAMDSTRVYVIGMSLGGYGTLDFVGTYPDKVAAAMALCGGCTLKDKSGLGKVPLWIIHGTADRAVPIKQSQVVVDELQNTGNDTRLRFDWLKGASHGALARILYMNKTYEWLFSHSLLDEGRPVNKDIDIDKSDLSKAYQDMISGAPDPEVVYDKTIY